MGIWEKGFTELRGITAPGGKKSGWRDRPAFAGPAEWLRPKDRALGAGQSNGVLIPPGK